MSELQNNTVSIWWSTGIYDPLFTPELTTSYSAELVAVRFQKQTAFCLIASCQDIP